MKITDARVIVTCPGRNFVTLKLLTDEGVHGVGDATLNGRELAVASYLRDHVIPCLLNRDPRQIEDTWQYLYRGAYWRRGPVTMRAIAAVDVALWDIKAKLANMPLYELLGGRSRDGVLVYGHANGEDIEATIRAVQQYKDLGYKAIRAQCGVPGLSAAYGVGKGNLHYEPADSSLPREVAWDSPAYLSLVPQLFSRLRDAYGDEVQLLHDAHHRLTPLEAAQLGKALEPHRLFWLEDVTPAENQEAFMLVRRHTTTPLAVGEVFNSIWDCKYLIEKQLIDYIRTSVVGVGGLTHLRRIADLAALYQIRTGCHGATDLSPITLGTAVHFDTWVPNFGIQEYMRHTAETDAVFPHDYRFENGYLFAGTRPGHGVDIDEGLASRFPYRAAYLPVARLADGTVWNW
jgi:mannonate dehydratase